MSSEYVVDNPTSGCSTKTGRRPVINVIVSPLPQLSLQCFADLQALVDLALGVLGGALGLVSGLVGGVLSLAGGLLKLTLAIGGGIVHLVTGVARNVLHLMTTTHRASTHACCWG